MHDRADVIRHTEMLRVVKLVELSHVRSQIVPVNLDMVISVTSLLLVPYSQSVSKLMDWDPKL